MQTAPIHSSDYSTLYALVLPAAAALAGALKLVWDQAKKANEKLVANLEAELAEQKAETIRVQVQAREDILDASKELKLANQAIQAILSGRPPTT